MIVIELYVPFCSALDHQESDLMMHVVECQLPNMPQHVFLRTLLIIDVFLDYSHLDCVSLLRKLSVCDFLLFIGDFQSLFDSSQFVVRGSVTMCDVVSLSLLNLVRQLANLSKCFGALDVDKFGLHFGSLSVKRSYIYYVF